MSGILDTFPKILLDNASRLANSPAIREKDYGIWQSWTWSEAAVEIRKFACGLAAKGFKRGDTLAIAGDNRPKLYWAMTAAQCIGGIPVPMYQDAIAEEFAHVIENADASFAVVEDQEQIDKLLEIKDRCQVLTEMIYEDPRGMMHYYQPFIHSYEAIQELGEKFDQENPGFFMEEVNKSNGSDTAILLYTSGTTGTSKGVVHTFDNVIITARNGVEREGLTSTDEALAYLPMGWVGDNLFSYAQAYVAGYCVNCPESGETVINDMREIGPTYYFAPPPVYENILTQVKIRMEDASWISQKIFDYFMDVAKKVGTDILDKQPVSFLDRFLYKMGDLFLYGPLKNVLGLSRIRLAYTAGEAIGPDLFLFFRSLGINIKQLYGQTESMVFVCIQPNGEVYPDTVGTPAKDVEVKITEEGEVLYRSPGVFHSYYKEPEKTKEAKTEDGWVYTGDAGYFLENGHLKIIDRVKDVGKMNDDTMFPPKYIENKLKFFPYIKEAVAFGHQRDYVTAFVCIDMQAVGNWAERRNMAYSGYTNLAAQKPVAKLILECIEKVNQDLSEDPQLSNTQIKRFLLLHKELDADDGELTRTRKVRRNFIDEKYPALINALYDGSEKIKVEAQVKFEDGRVDTIEADLKILEAKRIKQLEN
ncbi:MAG: AMP-binding protein [SAR324 cluster bacterium]|nr:AMP-binding protein [SAR324 cluster bacterium]